MKNLLFLFLLFPAIVHAASLEDMLKLLPQDSDFIFALQRPAAKAERKLYKEGYHQYFRGRMFRDTALGREIPDTGQIEKLLDTFVMGYDFAIGCRDCAGLVSQGEDFSPEMHPFFFVIGKNGKDGKGLLETLIKDIKTFPGSPMGGGEVSIKAGKRNGKVFRKITAGEFVAFALEFDDHLVLTIESDDGLKALQDGKLGAFTKSSLFKHGKEILFEDTNSLLGLDIGAYVAAFAAEEEGLSPQLAMMGMPKMADMIPVSSFFRANTVDGSEVRDRSSIQLRKGASGLVYDLLDVKPGNLPIESLAPKETEGFYSFRMGNQKRLFDTVAPFAMLALSGMGSGAEDNAFQSSLAMGMTVMRSIGPDLHLITLPEANDPGEFSPVLVIDLKQEKEGRDTFLSLCELIVSTINLELDEGETPMKVNKTKRPWGELWELASEEKQKGQAEGDIVLGFAKDRFALGVHKASIDGILAGGESGKNSLRRSPAAKRMSLKIGSNTVAAASDAMEDTREAYVEDLEELLRLIEPLEIEELNDALRSYIESNRDRTLFPHHSEYVINRDGNTLTWESLERYKNP